MSEYEKNIIDKSIITEGECEACEKRHKMCKNVNDLIIWWHCIHDDGDCHLPFVAFNQFQLQFSAANCCDLIFGILCCSVAALPHNPLKWTATTIDHVEKDLN